MIDASQFLAPGYTLGPRWSGQVCRSCAHWVFVKADQKTLRRVFPCCPECGTEYEWPDPDQDNGVYTITHVGSSEAAWRIER